jgi:hypothetical protein
MDATVHDRSRGTLVLAIVAATALLPQIASGEIFRCVARNGLPLYQNFPCEFDSLSAMATLVRTTGSQRPAAMPGVVPMPHVPVASQAEVGMSPAQVRDVLGEPLEIVPEQIGDQPSTEIWRYLDKRIRFHANHVAAVETWN